VDDLEARKEESTANETVVEKINDSNNNDDTIDNLVEDAAEISTGTATNEATYLTQNEQQIMSFSDDDYAVQLIGLRKEIDVKSFIAKYALTKMLYYKSSLAEQPWYIVILANYNTKEDASLARLNLSEDLRNNGPWVKSLKVIKVELSEAQQSFND
ncbi:MAG: septal ring-binding cell division protein DamX, partial [Enterobacterales bacterium]